MISDELLCIVQLESGGYDKYNAYLFNVFTREKVNTIELKFIGKKLRAIYPMKGKYLIICGEKNFTQYKLEQNNISLIHEKSIFESKGFVFFNNQKKKHIYIL